MDDASRLAINQKGGKSIIGQNVLMRKFKKV